MCSCTKFVIAVVAHLVFLVACCPRMLLAAEPEEDFDMVSYSEGFLSVNAKEVRPEDLMKEIGEKCGIKVVVLGEVFSEVPVSMQFRQMPLRQGIERVLRVASISNHVMHFEEADNGSRLKEINLIGKKGGERHLTDTPSSKDRTGKAKPGTAAPGRRRVKKTLKDQAKDKDTDKIQENFLNIMDKVLNAQIEDGEEPDPAEILKLFKDVVPEEMKDQIPPEVMQELEKLQ